jgi:hypothetical protein
MSLISSLDTRETDSSSLLSHETAIFDDLFNLMVNNKAERLFFLSSYGSLSKLEGLEIDDKILKALIKIKLDPSLAERATKTISHDISSKISERRAVSFREGTFGLIDPYEESRFEIQNRNPSANHIYGSYFTNTFALYNSLKKLYSSMSYSTVKNMIERFDGKIGSFVESIELCEDCDSFSFGSVECEHQKIGLKLMKIRPQVMHAWDKGILFPGYLGYVLRGRGWDTIVEKEIMGNCMHQIDLIAEKDKKIAIFECKHYNSEYKVPKNELMKSLGVMDDLEKLIMEKDSSYDIIKVYATTSDFHREIREMDQRPDIVLLKNKEIFATPENWVNLIE